MVKQTRDEKTLAIYSRQFGHLPDPGWRPARPTPLEAWEGLLLEDDPTPVGYMAGELFYQCGTFFSCGPLKPICTTLAKGRRLLYSMTKCIVLCFCGCLVPDRLRRHQRKVVAIVVPQQGLTGSLPKQPGWGLLKMKRLVLYGNALHGPLRGLNKYRLLEVLNLSSNRLTGRLPPSIGYLRRLRILDLHGNALTGNLDEQTSKARLHHLKSLTHISFDDNKFTGPFPSCCLKMAWIVELHLSGMELNGQIPDCHRLGKLKVLDLSFNAFTGPVPDFGRLPLPAPPSISASKKKKKEAAAASSSSSSKNKVEPSSVKHVKPKSSNVQDFTNQNNEKNDDDDVLENETPLQKKKREYKKLKLLKAQRMARAKADEKQSKGTVQSHVTNAAASEKTIIVNTTNQSSLSIQTRKGLPPEPVPETEEERRAKEIELENEKIRLENERIELEKINEKRNSKVPCLSLMDLKMSRNNLTGELPKSYGKLTNLQRLEIGMNKLSSIGGDDVAWDHLTKLEFVDFSRNKIEGPIPIKLASLEQLKILRLESNKFTGNIPDVLSRLQDLELIDLSKNEGLNLRNESAVWLKSVLKSKVISRVI